MINVIKINLNQASSKAARLEKRREQSRWAIFVLVALMMASGFAYLMYENAAYASIIQEKEMQIEDINQQIDSLQQEGRELSKEDILDMADLANRRILWAEKLNALGRLMPHDMAITHLTFKDRYLDISGVSRIYPDEREFMVIEEFIDRLDNDKVFSADFQEIKFSSYSLMTILNQNVVNFEIRATLKYQETTDTKRKKGGKS